MITWSATKWLRLRKVIVDNYGQNKVEKRLLLAKPIWHVDRWGSSVIVICKGVCFRAWLIFGPGFFIQICQNFRTFLYSVMMFFCKSAWLDFVKEVRWLLNHAGNFQRTALPTKIASSTCTTTSIQNDTVHITTVLSYDEMFIIWRLDRLVRCQRPNYCLTVPIFVNTCRKQVRELQCTLPRVHSIEDCCWEELHCTSCSDSKAAFELFKGLLRSLQRLWSSFEHNSPTARARESTKSSHDAEFRVLSDKQKQVP